MEKPAHSHSSSESQSELEMAHQIEPEPESEFETGGEQVTKVKLTFLQEVYIYSNFFFINNLLGFITNIIADMHEKRSRLIESSENKAIK